MSIEILGTEIEALDLKPKVTGNENLPTGGEGLYRITTEQIKDYILTYFAKDSINLGNVDNTSDEDKPISKAVRDALSNVILNNADTTVNSINGLTGNVLLTANSFGLGNVNNTSDLNKPLSKADIAALYLKVDKETFNVFESIFKKFQTVVDQKLRDLDSSTKENYKYALEHHQHLFQLDQEIENLRDYLDSEIHRVHHSLSNTQVNLILKLISDNFDNNLYHSLYFESVIQSLKDYSNSKLDLVYLELESLRKVDSLLDDKIKKLGSDITLTIKDVSTQVSNLKVSIDQQYASLNNLINEAKDYIDDQIASIPKIINQFKIDFKNDLNNLKDGINNNINDINDKIKDTQDSIDDKININNKNYVKDLYDNTIKTSTDYINSKADSFEKDLLDLEAKVDENGNYVETELEKSRRIASEKEKELRGLIESQVTHVDIVLSEKIDTTEKIINEVNTNLTNNIKDVNIRIDNTNKTLDETKSELDAETLVLKNEIAQERVDRDNAIKKAVDDAVLDIQHQLENIDLPAIQELSDKIDELNKKIEDGSAFISQEAIDHINAKVDELDAKLQNDINNLTNSLTLDQIDKLGQIAKLEDGLSKEIINRVDGNSKLLSNIENYKESNDKALANVQEGIKVQVDDAVSTSSKWIEINNRFTNIDKETGDLKDSITTVKDNIETVSKLNESTASTLESLSTTVNTNDTTVKGLIVEESKSRSTDIGNINNKLNVMQSEYDSLSSIGKNLLLKSNKELIRESNSESIGSYENGDNNSDTTNIDYTLIFSLSKKPNTTQLLLSLDNNIPLEFNEKVTNDNNKKVVHVIKFKAVPNFKFVTFKETPSSSTDKSIIHWAVLTKGLSIPVTDWIESPFDVEKERIKTNATISSMQETTATANSALSLRIDQNKTSIENTDKKVDSEITIVNQTITDLDKSVSSRLERISSDYKAADKDLSAAILTESETRVEENKVLVERINSIQSSFSAGFNLIPFIYTDPIEELNLKVYDDNFTSIKIPEDEIASYFYTKYYWSLNPRSDNGLSYVQFRLGSEFNIQLQPNKKHIISVYLKHNLPVNKDVELRLTTEEGEHLNGIVTVIPSSEFNRYFIIVDSLSSFTMSYLSIYFNNSTTNDILYISRPMVEQKDKEPSVWTSGTIGSTSTYVDKINTLNTNQVALAERFETLSSDFKTSDQTLRGLITEESNIRASENEVISNKINSIQSSFDNTLFGGQNYWEFKDLGINIQGNSTVVKVEDNLQHQSIKINSLDTNKLIINWLNLKVINSPILPVENNVSISFDIKSPFAKLLITSFAWGSDVLFTDNITTLPIDTWYRVTINDIKSPNTGASNKYTGLLGLTLDLTLNDLKAEDVIGKVIEIKNIQLQQGSKATGYVPPSISLDNDIKAAKASITTESNTRASENEAIATRIDGVNAEIKNSENRSTSRLQTEELSRIEGDRILSERIQVIESTTDQISIGGANLIPSSYIFKVGTTSNIGITTVLDSNSKLRIQATDLLAPPTDIFNFISSDLIYALNTIKNTGTNTFVISFWMKRENVSKPFVKHPQLRFNTSTNFVDPFFIRGDPTKENYYQVSYKFTIDTENDTLIDIAFRTRGRELESSLLLDRWKFEIGTVATDWTDFKESIIEVEKRTQASISNIQKTITDNNQALTSEINKATSLISDLPNKGINLLPYLTTIPKDLSWYKINNQVEISLNNNISPFKGINITTKDINFSSVILNSQNTPFNIELDIGRYLFSIEALSTTDKQPLSVDMIPVIGTNTATLKGASVNLTTTLKQYTFLFSVAVKGKYDIVLNVNDSKVINRLIRITKPMLEQQVGTGLKASLFVEGLVNSSYSLLPISASESNIISQIETTTKAGEATAKQVVDLTTSVKDENTKVQGQIININNNISNLESNTNVQINQVVSTFERDILRSSDNLISLKTITATSDGTISISEDRSEFIFGKTGTNSYFRFPVDFSSFEIGTKLVLSFNIKSNYVLKDIMLSQNELLRVKKVLVGDVEQIKFTDSRITFNTSLSVNKYYPITILFEVKQNSNTNNLVGISFNSSDKTFNVTVQYSMLSVGIKAVGWRLSNDDADVYKVYTNAQITNYSKTVANQFKAVAENQQSLTTIIEDNKNKAEADIATVNKTISDKDQAYAQQFNTINTKFITYKGNGNNLLDYSISTLESVDMFSGSVGLILSKIESFNNESMLIFKTIGSRSSFILNIKLGDDYSKLSDNLFSVYIKNLVPLIINTTTDYVLDKINNVRIQGKVVDKDLILTFKTLNNEILPEGTDLFGIALLMVEESSNQLPSTWVPGSKGVGSIIESSSLELRESIANTEETLNRKIDSMESSFNGRVSGGGNLWTVTAGDLNKISITGNASVNILDDSIDLFSIRSTSSQNNLIVNIVDINVVPNMLAVQDSIYTLSFKVFSTKPLEFKIEATHNTSIPFKSEIIKSDAEIKFNLFTIKFTGSTITSSGLKFIFPFIPDSTTVVISEVMFQEGNGTQYSKAIPYLERSISNTKANIEDHKKTYANDKQATSERLEKMSSEYRSSGGNVLVDNTTSNPSSWFSYDKKDLTKNFITVSDAPAGLSVFTITTKSEDSIIKNVYNLTTVLSNKDYNVSVFIKRSTGSLGYCFITTGIRNSLNSNDPISELQTIDVTDQVPVDNTWHKVNIKVPASSINTPNKYFGFKLNTMSPTIGGQVYLQGYFVSPIITAKDVDNSVASKANIDDLSTTIANNEKASAEKITKLESDFSKVDGTIDSKIATALVSYYTESQVNSAIAGKIEQYNASLSIGGDNLWSIENTPLINVTGTTTKTAIDTVLDYYRFTIDSFDSNGVNITRNSPMLSPVYYTQLVQGETYSLTFKIRSSKNGDATYTTSIGSTNYPKNSIAISLNTNWQTISFNFVLNGVNTSASSQNIIINLNSSKGWVVGNYYEIKEVMLQRGSKQTSYMKSSNTIQSSIKSNSTAISNTNSEVVLLGDKITNQSLDITKLQSTFSNINIGGNNLISKSNGPFRVGAADNSIITSRVLADGSLEITPTNINTIFNGNYFTNWWNIDTSFNDVISIPENSNITISLWFKPVNINNIPIELPSLYLNDDMPYLPMTGSIGILTSGEVQYYQTRKKIGKSIIVPHLSFSSASLKAGLILTKIKIEKGNIPTDWSSSFEDLPDMSQFATANSVATLNTEVVRQGQDLKTLSQNIVDLDTSLTTNTTLARLQSQGRPVLDDPTFNTSILSPYNLDSSQGTFVKRARSSDNPSGATNEYVLTLTKFISNNGAGYFPGNPLLYSAANKIFLVKQVVKAPLGSFYEIYANERGVNPLYEKLGTIRGTGTYETYYFWLKCGSTGNFSTYGHIRWFQGSAPTPSVENPFIVICASYECWDVTAVNDKIPIKWSNIINANTEATAALTNTTSVLNGKVETNASDLVLLKNRVDNTESGLSSTNTAMNNLSTRITDNTNSITNNASNTLLLEAKINTNTTSLNITGTKDTITALQMQNSDQLKPSLFTDSNSPIRVLRFTNYGRFHSTTFMTIDSNKLYRVKYKYRRVSGSGTMYLGLVCSNADKTYNLTANNTILDINEISSVNYVVVDAKPNYNVYQIGEYYFKGISSNASTGSGTIDDPTKFPASAAYFRLCGFMNYQNFVGTQDIEYLIVEEVDYLPQTLANSKAIQTTNAEVSRVNGIVTSHTNQITQLNSSIDDKVSSSVLVNYFTKDETNSAIAGQITTFNSKMILGGRNLVLNSSPLKVSQNYPFFSESLTQTLAVGDTVTITVWASLEPNTTMAIYNSGGNVQLATIPKIREGVYQTTFNWVIGGSTNKHIDIYALGHVSGGSTTVNYVQLERGNKGTDWTAAPEDLKVGSSNLIYNSDFSKDLMYWSNYQGLVSINNVNYDNKDIKYAYIRPNGGLGGLYIVASNINYTFRVGDVITISFIARSNNFNLTVGFDADSRDYRQIKISPDFKRYSLTIKRAVSTGNLIFFVDSGYVDISLIKVETGSIATDWSPASQDIKDSLSSFEATVRNDFLTKADSSGAIAQGTQEYIAKLNIGGQNLIRGTQNFDTTWNLKPNYNGFGSRYEGDKLFGTNIIYLISSNWFGFNFSGFPDNKLQQDSVLSFWASSQNNGKVYAYCITGGNSQRIEISGSEWRQYSMLLTKGTVVKNNQNQGVIEFDLTLSGSGNILAYSSIQLQAGNKATDWSLSPDDINAATASAINTTTASVTQLENRVTTNANQTLELTSIQNSINAGEIPGNKTYRIDIRDGRFGQDTYFPVVVSSFSAALRQTIRVWTTLDNSSKPNWSTHAAGFSLNVQWQTGGAAWGVITPELVIDNAAWAWTVNGQSPAMEIDQIGTSSQPYIYLRGGGVYNLSIPIGKSYQVCEPGGYIEGSGGVRVSPKLYDATKVPRSVNNRLESNSTSLKQTNEVIDGVKAISAVTVDHGTGLVSGYGLVSELINGQVNSTFGVNANMFYVGTTNANKKRPFVVLTEPGVINGVTVPAGTYIDSAWIGTATIRDAQIAELRGNKILANTITADKLTIGSVGGNLWVNQPFDQSGVKPEGRSQWNGGIAEIPSTMGVQCLGRDHRAPWSSRIPIKPNETFVIEFIGGHNSGPGKQVGVGLWYYDQNGNTIGNDYPRIEYVSAITSSGWNRYKTALTVPNNNNCKFAVLFVQIEQAENESDPMRWTIGDIVIRRAVGTVLIENGAITADKLVSREVSGMFASFGTLQVETANIKDLSIDTIKIKDNAVTSLIDIRKAPEGIEAMFPAISAGNPQTVFLKSVIATGLNVKNRYLVYWRGLINLDISNKNGSGYGGESAKIIYFGSTSSTFIANSLEIGSRYASGAYYNHRTLNVGDEKQWNIAEGIVDETGALCIWASARWAQYLQSTASNSLYAYLSVNSLVVLISEFKK